MKIFDHLRIFQQHVLPGPALSIADRLNVTVAQHLQ
jgi:hypothetical protein